MKLLDILQGKQVLIATRNQGKVKEFRQLFAPLGLKVISLHDIENAPEIIEDGQTFAQNAMKKALETADALHLCVIADDSGLCVDALDGRPGVYSARFAGEHASDADNNDKLLHELRSSAKIADSSNDIETKHGDATGSLLSSARFVCAMALVDPASGTRLEAEGSVEGYITDQPQGVEGFGYDPLFYIPELQRTMAQLTMDEKNAISHRGQAMRRLVQCITESSSIT